MLFKIFCFKQEIFYFETNFFLLSLKDLTKESHGEIWMVDSVSLLRFLNPRICFQGVTPKASLLTKVMKILLE